MSHKLCGLGLPAELLGKTLRAYAIRSALAPCGPSREWQSLFDSSGRPREPRARLPGGGLSAHSVSEHYRRSIGPFLVANSTAQLLPASPWQEGFRPESFYRHAVATSLFSYESTQFQIGGWLPH